MSIIRCDSCGFLIDSDDDPDCFLDDLWTTPEDANGVLCLKCREQFLEAPE